MRFDNELSQSGSPPLPILVAKFDKEIRAVICCIDWCGVRTHWYGGHTVAHVDVGECPACETGQDWVKKYYIVARSTRTGNHAVLMLTPLAAEAIVQHRSKEHGLLGCEIVLGRAAARNTSPMTARVIDYHPDEPDFGTTRLERVIRRIFKENKQTGNG